MSHGICNNAPGRWGTRPTQMDIKGRTYRTRICIWPRALEKIQTTSIDHARKVAATAMSVAALKIESGYALSVVFLLRVYVKFCLRAKGLMAWS
jgi:hypothetical protein